MSENAAAMFTIKMRIKAATDLFEGFDAKLTRVLIASAGSSRYCNNPADQIQDRKALLVLLLFTKASACIFLVLFF